VLPAGATTTSGLGQSASIPGAIFVAGYNLELLDEGENNIPANVRSTIEATNTVQGSQNTNVVGGTPAERLGVGDDDDQRSRRCAGHRR
jgi:hypothetical protein